MQNSPFIRNWNHERQSAHLYEALAKIETNATYRQLFQSLAEAARQQADHWASLLNRVPSDKPLAYQPNFRVKLVIRLTLLLGIARMKPILAALKVRGLSVYSSRPIPVLETHLMPRTVQEVGLRHHHGVAGSLRPAVFGVNDGIVSTASLIVGMAGAGANSQTILVAGVAGVVAGALSMAAGEYISVRSQKETVEHQLDLEREELNQYPDEEAAELSLIYQARGLSKIDADRLGAQMIQNPEQGLETLAREELGINPHDLGSPVKAGFASLLSFAVGGIIPLFPYFFIGSAPPLNATLAITSCALFGVGAALSLFTGKNSLISGLRMVLLGGGAGALSYALGRAIEMWIKTAG